MDKEFYDKYSKDLECSCCQDLEHCINGKEPLKTNCAIHYFKDKIADLETELLESEEVNKKLAEHSQSVDKALDDSCDVIRTLKQQLAEKEKEKEDWIRAFEELALDSIDHESYNATVDEYEKEIEELKIYQNQTAIAELEKVKEIVLKEVERVEETYTDGFQSGFNCCYVFMKKQIDQQIKELKGETKDD